MSNQKITEYRTHFKKGDVLLKEGETGTEIILPEKGVLDIFIQGKKVNSFEVAASQDFIGEVGAILGTPRTATVVAATDCVALCLPKMELEAVLKNAPSLGFKLVRSLCRKLLNSSSALAEFQLKSSTILE